jgi:hypothetical protein
MSFQKTVLIVALISFLIMMVFIAVMMNSAKKVEDFPPQVGSCPDYWQIMPGTGECLNTQLLGSTCASPYKFATKTFKEKCDFAKECGITWDGITNSKKCR